MLATLIHAELVMLIAWDAQCHQLTVLRLKDVQPIFSTTTPPTHVS